MTDVLLFVDSTGMPERVRVLRAEPDEPHAPGSPFRTRMIALEDGRHLSQRRIHMPHAVRPEALDALETEIRAGLRLARAFGQEGYPPEFTRLAGYSIEAPEPFLLLDPLRKGQPMAEFAGRLMVREQQKFEYSLFRTLRLLEWASLVHRSIGPRTVRWDGSRIQLTQFGGAELAGRPRRRLGVRPWASPEQREGVGAAHPLDDVWSAGQLVHFVATGRESAGDRPPPGSGQALTDLLRGVFEEDPARRCDARTLLRRISGRDPVVDLGEAPDPLRAGRRRFDELLAAKGPQAWPPRPRPEPAAPTPPEPVRPPRPDAGSGSAGSVRGLRMPPWGTNHRRTGGS
ncbi:hypothetical protein [Streptomyces sp. NPDC002328]|uniref:hypothetical protein n=1 Tax=Streptomyces sp. NPDC002328 TaxID=3364642 RepID=UPI0036A6294E